MEIDDDGIVWSVSTFDVVVVVVVFSFVDDLFYCYSRTMMMKRPSLGVQLQTYLNCE